MSKPIFKGFTAIRIMGKPKPQAWRCEHKHGAAETASLCAQKELRQYLANSRDKSSSVRLEEATFCVVVKHPEAPTEQDSWVPLSFYREHFDSSV